MDERLYWLWLAHGLGPAARQLPQLLEQYGSAKQIFAHRMEICRRRLVTQAQQRVLATSRPEQFFESLARHEDAGVQILVYSEEAYPPLLRQIDSPPPVLYLVGDAACLSSLLMIGMVGTRRPSAYGMDAARTLADGFAKAGAVLVSGLAEGLDSEAHRAAVRAQVPTVAVLGTAIDQCFPAKNAPLREQIEQCGAVISEFPIGTPGKPAYFLARNRMIAGLSKVLCVVEARMRSGTMSTVQFALDYGRDVYAVPGSIFSPLSEGTNRLLAEGARVLTKPQDLLEDWAQELMPQYHGIEKQAPQEEIPVQQKLSLCTLSRKAVCLEKCLLASRAKGMEELCRETGLSAGEVMAALTELELEGLCVAQPGRLFLHS
ncbi:MAG: DNA-processing protein DprA [Pygmaiobacter massiliensis]|nr:DNA-processing protein DprA [Pygmaiobacter massiliensis]